MPRATKRTTKRTTKLTAKRTKQTTVAAEAFDVSDQLHSYDETYLVCRDLRHAWTIVGYFEGNGLIMRRLTCERCPVQRTDRLQRNGAREHPKYDYPEDYKLSGRVASSDVVQEVLTRVDVYGSEEQLFDAMFSTSRRGRRNGK